MVWGLQANPLVRVEKHPMRASGDIQVFSPEEVWRSFGRRGSSRKVAIFLTAAFTGLRMGELIALRWRDVDFAGATIRVRGSFAAGYLTTPRSGKVRVVPMAPDVATALAQLGARENWIGDDDLVFVQVRARLVPGRLRAAPALQAGARSCWSPSVALPRPAPHVRDADDRQG